MKLENFICHFLTVAVGVTLLVTAAEGQLCREIEWRVNWTEETLEGNFGLFNTPGEIINGFTVSELMEPLGLAWNAPSWHFIAGLICLHFGPFLNSLDDTEDVRNECDIITAALREGERWDTVTDCRRLWTTTGIGNLSEGALGIANTGDPAIDQQMTIEKLSAIAFEVLEWLGPSPFSGDVFGGCSALRIFLNMNIQDIVSRIKTISAYPVTLLFQGFGSENICGNVLPESANSDYIRIIDALSDPSDPGFCQFLSNMPSKEDYLNRATSVIVNTCSVLTSQSTCGRLLEAYSEIFDESAREIFTLITGADLNSFSSREDLCTDISIAFDTGSTFSPDEYSVPVGQNLSTWDFSSVPGELLPGLSFQDAANIAGAFYRSGTLAEGLTVICSVFESFLVENIPDIASNVTDICAALRRTDLEQIEKKCLEMTVPLQYGDLPISLRIPTAVYMAVTAIDFARVLFTLDSISETEVCESFDEFVHSDNNLQTVVRSAVDTCLAELLSIAHNICEDYDNVYRYLIRNEVASATEESLRVFILAHLGYTSREELCAEVASGISVTSGRAMPELVENFQTNILKFIEDEDRCIASADAFLTAVVVSTFDDGTDEDSFLLEYIGYESTMDACSDLNNYFRAMLCSDNDDDSGSISKTGNLFLVCFVMLITLGQFHDV